jgi:hypothetical protein
VARKGGFLASYDKDAPRFIAPKFRDLRKAISFAFQIDHVSPSYSLRMVPNGEQDRCEQHASYLVKTTCLSPPKYAGRETEFILFGADDVLDSQYVRGAAVGRLTMRRNALDYAGAVPTDELHRAMGYAISGLYRYITLISDSPGRGGACVHVISFEDVLDPEDYPEVDGS